MKPRGNQIFRWLGAAVALSMCACSSNLTAKVVPGADLRAHRDFYVVETEDNDPEMAPVIVKELERLGFAATSGPGGKAPEDADALVRFTDRWMWDITMYLLQLTITIDDAKTNLPLASGESMRTSLVRKSPDMMAREVLEEIFETKPGGAS